MLFGKSRVLLVPDADVGAGGDGDAEDGKAKGGKKGDDKGTPRVYTDEEMNAVIAKNRRKWDAEKEALLAQVSDAQKGSDLSKQERARLARLQEELEASLTEEQKSKREIEKRQKALAAELEAEKQAGSQWRSRFTSEVVNNAILRAAGEHKAFNPDQIQAIVGPLVVLEEKQDKSGKISHAPVVKFIETVDGREEEQTVSVSEYVKRMASMEKYGNLFVSGAVSGTGSRGGSTGSGGGAKIKVTRADVAAGKVSAKDMASGKYEVI